MLYNILRGIPDLDINGGTVNRFYYDGAVKLNADSEALELLTQTAVSQLVFLGSELDDCMTHEEVVIQILQYLNLHIIQRGADFFIFSWETLKAGGHFTFSAIFNENVYMVNPSQFMVDSRALTQFTDINSISYAGLPRERLEAPRSENPVIPGNVLELVWDDEIHEIEIYIEDNED